jgi:hypothetical protein
MELKKCKYIDTDYTLSWKDIIEENNNIFYLVSNSSKHGCIVRGSIDLTYHVIGGKIEIIDDFFDIDPKVFEL